MDEERRKLMEKFAEKLEESDLPKSLMEMDYDELYNEIMLNSEDIDALTTISEAIRMNNVLTEFEKNKLWQIIDKMMKKRG